MIYTLQTCQDMQPLTGLDLPLDWEIAMWSITGKRLPVRTWLEGGWVVLLIALVFAGPITWLVREWGDNPYYGHGPLVPLVSLVLVALVWPHLGSLLRRNSQRSSLPVRPAGLPVTLPWGFILVATGLGLRLLGTATESDFLGALALLLVLAGIGRWWLGREGMRLVAFPLAYLAFAIPLPFMDDIGFYFQRLSTAATTVLLKLGGVPASYQGAEVSLPSASFVVGVQCSGLYSTVTLTALGLLYVYMLNLRSWPRRLLLIAVIPLVTVTANVFRLGSLLTIAYWQNADVAMRYYHALGDVVFWFLAMALLFVIGKGLEWTQPRGGS
ncbi:MAG: exosortase/archaeosortase family protein [Chloroflexi bacterium]|nr:exosortase/archaeosortase family protein [Chloroflexota bacterium]